MKFRTAFLILSCSASFAATAPANIDHAAGELITKRGKAADCQFRYAVLENLFWIKMWGWGDDYGRGLLDNIRGQCGPVTEWVCKYYSSSGAWEAGGSLPLGIRSHCVEDAIWLASGGIEGVQCHVSAVLLPAVLALIEIGLKLYYKELPVLSTACWQI